MVYVWEFEFFEEDGFVNAFPCGDFGHGATCGEDFNDAVEMAADFLSMAVDDHLMNGTKLPPMEFGHEPEHGGKIVAVAVSRDLSDIPAVTASEASRMLGVSTARVSQLIKSKRLESWKVGGTRMVSLESVHARMEESARAENKKAEAVA